MTEPLRGKEKFIAEEAEAVEARASESLLQGKRSSEVPRIVAGSVVAGAFSSLLVAGVLLLMSVQGGTAIPWRYIATKALTSGFQFSALAVVIVLIFRQGFDDPRNSRRLN